MLITKLSATRALCACDVCGTEIVRSFNRMGELQFCTRACMTSARKAGGVLQRKTEATALTKYGVTNVAKSVLIKEQTKQTCMVRYGVSAPVLSPEIDAKRRKTLEERYGVDQTFKSTDVRAKSRDTKLERYGEEWPAKLDATKQKVIETNMERYGVPSPFSLGSPFRSADDCSKGGQVSYRAQGLKAGGEGFLSKPELQLRDLLVEQFGVEDVDQQVVVQHGVRKPWLIDFYVKSIDTYVQSDGVYWHGLDRAYNELHPDAQKTYDHDRQQDQWFVNNGRRLIRITDKQVKEWMKTGSASDALKQILLQR